MSVWSPSERAVVSHVTPYVEVVSSTPIRVLVLYLNWTPTRLVSEALADIVTDAPETVESASGAVRETIGSVVSMVTGERAVEAVEVLPTASVSLKVMELAPVARVPVVAEKTPPEHATELPDETPSS